MKTLFTILILLSGFGCKSINEMPQTEFLEQKIPNDHPLEFKPHLIPSDQLIHKGIFSPDLEAYYFTLSDPSFKKFEVSMTQKVDGKWSDPQPAFFNSDFNEHGMSFSPDGNALYFSSTRPTGVDGIPDTWHIWRSEKIGGTWTEPVYVDIPNMSNQLISHPSITRSGKLYFHASNLDYSEMDIYHTQLINGIAQNALKVEIAEKPNTGICTPFISADEEYLLFASIGQELDLWISFNDGQGHWTSSRPLNESINHLGQGNPYVTLDHQFLFFTTGEHQKGNWRIKWVKTHGKMSNLLH